MTYDEMAAALGVTRCRGRTPSGHRCDQQHDLEGSVDKRGAEHGIHFSERPVQRPSTLVFLKLVARVEEPSIDFDTPWRRIYRMNMAVRDLAVRLHIQYPDYQASADRAFVLASVAGMSNAVPMRRQAFDWARRGPKRKED